METIRKKLLYSNLSSEEYDIIKDDINQTNAAMLRWSALIASILLAILTIVSFFASSLERSRNLYALTFVSMLFVYILTKICARWKPRAVIICWYLMLTCVFTFAIILGVPLMKDSPATTICVLLFALPLMVNDRPLRMDIYLFAVTVIFCSYSSMMKTAGIASLDRTNGLSFLFLSIIVNYFISRSKCQEILSKRMAIISYQRHLDMSLKSNQNTVGSFRMNLSKDTCGEGISRFPNLLNLQKNTSINPFFEHAATLIPGETEKEKYLNLFQRENMLKAFENGTETLSMEHHFILTEQYSLWIRTSVDMMKNPLNREIEAIVYVHNIHMEKVSQALISEVIMNDYDVLAVLYGDSDRYIYMDKEDTHKAKVGNEFYKKLQDDVLDENPDHKEEILLQLNKNSVSDALKLNHSYTVYYTAHPDDRTRARKKIRFSNYNKTEQVVGIMKRDVTDVFELEERSKEELSFALKKAQKANAAKSDFISKISHDIRTPMNGIIGMANMIEESNDIEEIKDFDRKMRMSAKFLLGLVNDVLDVSEIEEGKMQLRPEYYNNGEFVDYIEGMIKPICDERDITLFLTNEVDEEIYVDPLRLNQICTNILSNSVKYTPDGGRITLQTKELNRTDEEIEMMIIITDNGIGMSESYMEHMFEQFSQEGARAGNEKLQGSGLGLYIVKQIVDLMNGQIHIDSEENEGTEVRISFKCPYRSIRDDSKEINPEISDGDKEKIDVIDENADEDAFDMDAVDFHGEKVLLCEDNDINAMITIALLEHSNMKVDRALDGLEGLDIYEKSQNGEYKAILMDIRMPNMDGLEATRCIRALDRKEAKEIPIIALTANAFTEDYNKSMEAGMTEHLSKPIDRKVVLQTLLKYI